MIPRIFKIALVVMAFMALAGLSAYLTLTFIIKGEQTVVVPDLESKEVVTALQLLSDLKLNTKVAGSVYHPTIPANHVVSQDPAPGREIKVGRDVRIIISKGSAQAVMPNVVGVSMDEADIILSDNGLCVRHVSRTLTTGDRPHTVIAQYPAAGRQMMRRGCQVDLLVSSGIDKPAVVMPDLVGLGFEEAILRIERTGLVGDMTRTEQRDRPLNTIIDQDPSAGYRVRESDTVRITINRSEPGTGQAPSSSFPDTGLFRYRLADGFLNRHVRLQVTTGGFTYDLFDDFVKPGTELIFLVPRPTDTVVMLYIDDELIKTKAYRGA